MTAEQWPNWQPIETAPRDGTWILATRGGRDDLFSSYADIMCFNDGAYTVKGAFAPLKRELKTQPTHWLPLPAPPARETTR